MTAPAQARARAHVVDAVRGLACLWMIEWHTADAWLLPALRGTTGFSVAETIGGIAAPWFFLLAGVASGLTETTAPERRRAALVGSLQRAGQILVLGYALKLFALGVDRGGLASARAPAVVMGALGIAAAHEALGGLGWLPERHRRPATRVGLGGLGLLLFGAMLAWLRGDAEATELVLRLDVLQGIGAALAVLALVLSIPVAARAPRVLLPLGLALAVALTTPVLARVDWTPSSGLAPIVDYLARFPPYPAPSGARFPFFPWLGYALMGAAIGRAMRGAPIASEFGLPRREGARVPEPALAALVVGVGLGVAALAFEAGPSAQAVLARTELARNVLRLTYNTSLAIGSAGAISLLSLVLPSVGRALALLGRHSLVVYAVHLEIAYGLPGVPLVRTLGWPAWLAGAIVLAALMGALSHAIELRARAASTPARGSQA